MPKTKDADDGRKDQRTTPEQPNPGLPDPGTVVSERMFTSPKGRRYRIIKTTETDPYDPLDHQKRREGGG
jgi:hypothetical protein